jgi:hypothetical protein
MEWFHEHEGLGIGLAVLGGVIVLACIIGVVVMVVKKFRKLENDVDNNLHNTVEAPVDNTVETHVDNTVETHVDNTVESAVEKVTYSYFEATTAVANVSNASGRFLYIDPTTLLAEYWAVPDIVPSKKMLFLVDDKGLISSGNGRFKLVSDRQYSIPRLVINTNTFGTILTQWDDLNNIIRVDHSWVPATMNATRRLMRFKNAQNEMVVMEDTRKPEVTDTQYIEYHTWIRHTIKLTPREFAALD